MVVKMENEVFSAQNAPKDWNKELFLIVRIVSSLALLLLLEYQLKIFSSIISAYYYDVSNLLVLDILLGGVLTSFSLGCVIFLLQLRFINNQRSRNFLLSGFLLSLGFFLTLVTAIVQKFIPTVFNFINYSNWSLLFFAGLLCLGIAAITEITRIDEPLIFWLHVNIIFILRLILSLVAILLLILGREQQLGITLSLFAAGYLLFIISWINHSYFKTSSTLMNLVLIIWGIILIDFNQLSLSFNNNFVHFGTISVAVIFNSVLWRKELYLGLVTLITALRKFTVSTISSVVNFFKRNGLKILRYTITLISVLLILFSPLLIPRELLFTSYEFYRGLGLALIYIAWLHQVNYRIKLVSIKTVGKIQDLGHFVVENYRYILKSASISFGGLLVWIGIIGILIDFSKLIEALFLVFVGIFLVMAPWTVQIITYLKRVFVSVKNLLTDIFNYLIAKTYQGVLFVRENYIDVLRAILTIISSVLIIYSPPVIIQEQWFGLLNISRILGIITIYICFFTVINKIVIEISKRAKIASIKLFILFKKILAWIWLSIKDIATYLVFKIRQGVNFVKQYYIDIIRYSASFLSIVLVFFSPPVISQEQWFGLLNISRLLGFIVLYLCFIKTINNFIKGLIISLKELIIFYIEFIITHFHEILVFFGTIIGIGLFILSPPILETEKAFGLTNITRFMAIFILYLSWFSSINGLVTITASKTYLGIIKTLNFLKREYLRILRYSFTFIGVIFVFIGFPLLINEQNWGLFNVSRGVGLFILYIAWFQLVNAKILFSFNYSLEKITLFGHYIYDHKIQILKGLLTILGIGFIILGIIFLYLEEEVVYGAILLSLALIVEYVTWFSYINAFLSSSLHKISQLVIRMFKRIGHFIQIAINQLKEFFIILLDHSFTIILFILSSFLVVYGIFLFSSAIVGDLSPIILDLLPWLNFLTSLLGQKGTFLGVFTNSSPIVWLLLGVGFSVVGCVLSFMIYLNREKMRLNVREDDSKIKKNKKQVEYIGGEL
jgi:hypothetical protein